MTKSQQEKEEWKTKASKRAQKTEETTKFLKAQGYHVIEMRECHFRNQIRCNDKLKSFVDSRQPPTPQREMTKEEILKAVVDETFFGMVEVDIKVPGEWPDHFKHPTMTPYQYFEEMSPIFCTSEVPYDVIGDHMQQYVNEFDLSTKPRRLLVGGLKARKILLATPLLKWYLDHGLEVTKIYQTVEFQKSACFQNFVKDVSDARRQGDADPNKAIIADTRKLEGNSAFGSTIMDQERFQDTVYVKGDGPAMMEVNLPQFKKMTPLDKEYYEIEKAKTTLRLNLPVQIGYYILQLAKLHMLQFYYDFMDEYVDRSMFEYCEMDTDSAYMALATSDFLSAIKPEMKAKFLRGLQGHCQPGLAIEADCKDHWFPRTCCPEHAKFDKRTPGLFKIEYEGDAMIGLCSKTYIVAKKKTLVPTNTVLTAYRLLRKAKRMRPKRLQPAAPRTFWEKKFSSKGVSKKTVVAPLATFRRVLETKKPGSGTNRGFRARNNTIYTYQQERSGFSYFYCKRKVLADGRTTVPLDLELCATKDTEPMEVDVEPMEVDVEPTEVEEEPMEVESL